MIGEIDRRPIAREVVGASDAKAYAAERAAQAHAAVPQPVQHAFPAKKQRQQHAGGTNDQDVKRNHQVGRQGSERGNEHRAIKLREKS